MKKLKILLSGVVIVLFSHLTIAQKDQSSTCKVVMESISEYYTGECKKGLAHGEGVAKGEATYIGEFKKGLPHGHGKYISADSSVYEGRWKKGKRNGQGKYTFIENNKKKVLTGIWRKDVYRGDFSSSQGYKVIRERSVKRVAFRKTGHLPDVDLKFVRGGTPSRVNVRFFEASSGLGYSTVQFPYRCALKFEVPNELNTNRYLCELEFEITEPGYWTVYVYY